MTHQTPDIPCSEPECPATAKGHRWGKIHAQRSGWFFQLDGRAWCPDHLPSWLAAWRRRNAEAVEAAADEEGSE